MIYPDVMIDLETMGNSARAAFVQIGAVQFDARGESLPATPERGTARVLLINVDLDSVLRLGMRVDAGTIMWWMKNSDAARASLVEPTPIAVEQALARLKVFIPNWKATKVWSKGPSFDITILGEAYRALGNKWGLCSYVNERCVRTIYDLAGIDDYAPGEGIYHNALDDAWKQACRVQEAYRRLRQAAVNNIYQQEETEEMRQDSAGFDNYGKIQ